MAITSYINTSDLIGGVITGLTTELTGSIFLSMLLIFLLLLITPMIFRLPIEISAVMALPLLLASAASPTVGGNFMPLLAAFLIYLGIISAKMFFYKD